MDEKKYPADSRQISSSGATYIMISTRMLDLAMQRGVEVGVHAAMDFLAEERKAQRKSRYDRRLRNTRLLLRNYRVFRDHVAGAIYDAKQMRQPAVDILDDLDESTIDSMDDDLYVESIKRSQQRTLIILDHIDQMLEYFRIYCESSHKPEDMRRYHIIMALYIDEKSKNADQLAEEYNIDRSTVYKDVKEAIKPLSGLIFGVDSLRLY